IVIDEEHERTYKQEDAPRYHARDVAIMRAKMEHAVVILGTATPSLESYFNAQKGKYNILHLSKRVENRALPKVRIIDMRKEVDRHARFTHFSHLLETQIKNCLSRKEQAIIFLNRRGFSPVVMCPKCGKSISCEHCDMALTYHRTQNLLMCHLCGITKKMLTQCPNCQHANFKQLGVGTQRIESLLRKILPQIKIERMDTDSTTHKDAHYNILKMFRDGHTQVLVGTQMIAKGLDFPNVTLVGVISADIAMSLPDFRMGEYIFQLLTQVAGRSGRGEKGGEVFVQTFTPMHPVIRAAAAHDYLSFYEAEIQYRRELNYPPFYCFVVVLFEGRSQSSVKDQAQDFARALAQKAVGNLVRVVGPHPAPLERIKENYRWQIIASAKTRLALHGLIRLAWNEVEKKSSVKITVDVDPMSMT
ncbi:MAG: primosomal protein N', partial [Chlamydiota bacterium]|nr:primosomal protein N' [Chlamydiota bacterium]